MQRLCVTPGGCGNGVQDDHEQCDDGNLLNGDGKVNAFASPAEQCDDGANADGDACSAICEYESAFELVDRTVLRAAPR